MNTEIYLNGKRIKITGIEVEGCGIVCYPKSDGRFMINADYFKSIKVMSSEEENKNADV